MFLRRLYPAYPPLPTDTDIASSWRGRKGGGGVHPAWSSVETWSRRTSNSTGVSDPLFLLTQLRDFDLVFCCSCCSCNGGKVHALYTSSFSLSPVCGGSGRGWRYFCCSIACARYLIGWTAKGARNHQSRYCVGVT